MDSVIVVRLSCVSSLFFDQRLFEVMLLFWFIEVVRAESGIKSGSVVDHIDPPNRP